MRWLGLAGGKDHVATRRAVDDGYVLRRRNEVREIRVDTDRTVTIEQFDLPE